MLQRLLDGHAPGWVEHAHLPDNVQPIPATATALSNRRGRGRGRGRRQGREGEGGGHEGRQLALRPHSRSWATSLEQCHRLGWHPCRVPAGGHAQHDDGSLQLVVAVLAREERLASPHLVEDATHRPHVHRRPVLGARQQHLGRAVPARDDVLRELFPGRVHRLAGLAVHGDAAAQAEVTDLDLTVAHAHEDVRRLEVPVDDVPAVEMQEAEQHL
mmetsp:Transcript_63948/g.208596  ORF Transcript_63948/g.208596 Transcript_63948/m.208596 type:complete len:215 (-) Transcript_63948:480-1124(-)